MMFMIKKAQARACISIERMHINSNCVLSSGSFDLTSAIFFCLSIHLKHIKITYATPCHGGDVIENEIKKKLVTVSNVTTH